MKSGAGSVFAGDILPHHPGIGVAHFLNGIRRQPDHVWIPAGHAGIVARHTLSDLYQGMLDVARFLIVLQILAKLLV